MKHTTVALFVPHRGCPHQCSFCNQKSISGECKTITEKDVHSAVEIALKNPELENGEIAFFGGSFTAIERSYMTELLQAAKVHIDGKKFRGIRISTRPDAVDDEICRILKENKVVAVELGAQSLDDKVLSLNKRGHTVRDVENAVSLLKKYGFETGLQMMTGLYGSDDNESLETGRKIINLHPDTVRIYPTVVIENTPLAQLYKSGKYKAQTVDSAADICARLIEMFNKANIRIIRVGLHSGGGVEQDYVAGAFHPAFKEICESRIYLNRIKEQLDKFSVRRLYVYVPEGAVSQAMGHKKENIKKLEALGYKCSIKELHGIEKYQVLVKDTEYDT